MSRRHVLEWTARQAAILSGGGVAEALYTAGRGFPFEAKELPHHHLAARTAREKFVEWRSARDFEYEKRVVGAWERLLFAGGWDHTTDATEDVANVQTPSLFVDIRVPHARDVEARDLGACSADDLRVLARQHAFGGFTKFGKRKGVAFGVRHHSVDWNYVGSARSRPNKWRIEPRAGNDDDWKEWSWATDDHGQSYYFEHWRRLPASEGTDSLALLGDDTVLAIVGKHFAYVRNRRRLPFKVPSLLRQPHRNCAEAVDAALAADDRPKAEDVLSVDAGHGLAHGHWTVDLSLQPWDQGRSLFDVLFDGARPRRRLPGGRLEWPPYTFDILEDPADWPPALDVATNDPGPPSSFPGGYHQGGSPWRHHDV